MSQTHARLMRRAEIILDELLQREYVAVEALAAQLNVSTATIRKDLAQLEERGLLSRVHGGAVMAKPAIYEPFRRRQNFGENKEKHSEEKRRIALVAARRIADGETIAFTGGTTVTQVASSIHYERSITVITNAINIAMDLFNRERINVFVPGGFLRGSMFSLTGLSGIRAIGEFKIDKIFIGINGIHTSVGLTTMDIEHAALHRALIQQATTRICVADHTKIGQIYSTLVCGVEEIDCLITGRDAAPDFVRTLRQKGVEVVLV